LNAGPPAPKAGAPVKTTLLFSALLLKNNNLADVGACGWLCATVPICLQVGTKIGTILGAKRHARTGRSVAK
jgi:hypothetical protein